MYNQNPQNGQFYGSAPQAGVYPQQAFGAPQPYGAAPVNMPNQPFQPVQNPAQGNGWAQPAQANPSQSGGQQDRLKYTPAIYEKPESGKPEDLVMTLVLGISTTQNLFFNKFLSKNGNVCVGVAADIVLSDQFVADMFGQHVVAVQLCRIYCQKLSGTHSELYEKYYRSAEELQCTKLQPQRWISRNADSCKLCWNAGGSLQLKVQSRGVEAI